MKKKIIFTLFLMLITISFSDVTLDIEQITRQFGEYASKVQQMWGVPGMAIGIVQGEQVIFKEVFGYRTHEEKDPVEFETTFQIGSTSKAFTSMMFAIAEQKGLMSWTDKVRDHYPEFEMYDPYVTAKMELRDIMAQHSGMAPYSGDLTQMMGFDAEYILKHLKDIKPVKTFRSDYTYVNSLFLVAQKIIENMNGLSFEAALQQEIFDPLGMKDTTISYDKYLLNANRTMTYVYEVVSGEENNEILLKSLDPESKGFKWSYNYAPAGGIDASLNDMLKWVGFHVNGGAVQGKQLIASHALDILYQPATSIYSDRYGKYVAYCQGWVYETVGDQLMIWHNGSTMGSKTMVAFFPKMAVGIVIMANMGGINLPDNLVKDFLDMITGNPPRQLALKEVQTVLSAELNEEIADNKSYPSMNPEIYTGKYFNALYGEIDVYNEGDNLFLKIGPDEAIMTFRHLNRDTFNLYWDELYLGEVANCTFILGKEGLAEKIEVDLLEEEGTGIFIRIQ